MSLKDLTILNARLSNNFIPVSQATANRFPLLLQISISRLLTKYTRDHKIEGGIKIGKNRSKVATQPSNEGEKERRNRKET